MQLDPDMSLPSDQPPPPSPPAKPKISAEERRTREADRLRSIRLRMAIGREPNGVGASVTDEPGRYLGFLALYDAVFAIISWASFEYVVTE